MGIVKTEIDDDIKRKLWKKAFEKFGYSKGSISLAIKEAIIKWLDENENGEDDTQRERLINNLVYQNLENKLLKEYKGKYVLIANGKLIATAGSYDDIVMIANERVPNAKHRLIFKVEERMYRKVGRLGWRMKIKKFAGVA